MECDFGQYKPDATGRHHVDGRVPPEMIKKRLAVIMNCKLHNGIIVVPISSTHDKNKVDRGYHVRIDPRHITETAFYDRRDRWAKADLIQQVSKERLSTVRGAGKKYVTDCLPRDLVAQIQCAVMKAINGASLLKPPAAESVEELVAVDQGRLAQVLVDKLAQNAEH